ncbi:MAG TPA: hypothetical protein VGL40_16010 [Bacillota bacterium]|jgi:hypothetical protein
MAVVLLHTVGYFRDLDPAGSVPQGKRLAWSVAAISLGYPALMVF